MYNELGFTDIKHFMAVVEFRACMRLVAVHSKGNDFGGIGIPQN